MPPKKKARLSRAISTPLRNAEHALDEPPTPMDIGSGKEDNLMDAWTDEQETSLFKSMIRWKPVGMHKHFRMIAISENLRNHGYTSAKDDHTRIPGIWEKLHGLYNLEALDERENDVGNNRSDERDPLKEPYYSFALPEEEYGESMAARRLAPEGSQSPPVLQDGHLGRSTASTRRQSTIDDTDYPKSSPASTVGTSRGVQGSLRGAKGRFTGKSQLKEQSVSVVVKGQARKTNKTPVKGEGGEEEDENDDQVDHATPKAANKGTAKASAGKSSRRKSGRKR